MVSPEQIQTLSAEPPEIEISFSSQQRIFDQWL